MFWSKLPTMKDIWKGAKELKCCYNNQDEDTHPNKIKVSVIETSFVFLQMYMQSFKGWDNKIKKGKEKSKIWWNFIIQSLVYKNVIYGICTKDKSWTSVQTSVSFCEYNFLFKSKVVIKFWSTYVLMMLLAIILYQRRNQSFGLKPVSLLFPCIYRFMGNVLDEDGGKFIIEFNLILK